MDVHDLLNFPGYLGQWVYQLYSVKIPILNISLWLLTVSVLAFTLVFRVFDPFTHRSQSFSQDQNNNRVFRER